MQKTVYENYKYSLQDTAKVYIGAKYTFAELLDQDEEIENLIRIFVYADRVRRVQRVMEVDCISEERAKKRIRKIENERKNYYKYFTGNDWKNMKNYDLPINTTRLGLDETAELIKEYVKLRGYMK